jgi:hypothetical protein
MGVASRQAMMNAVAAHHPGMPRPTPIDNEDPWARITRLRRARTRSAHASCWSHGDQCEALWRLYCFHDRCQGVGVALKTTLACLKQSVSAHNLHVSPITYLKYDEAPAFTDDMQPLMHKRHAFFAEQELRLLKFDEAQFNALGPEKRIVPELAKHIYLDNWVLRDVINEIIISPYADVGYEQWVRDAIKTADASLADRVALSELHERRYAPAF